MEIDIIEQRYREYRDAEARAVILLNLAREAEARGYKDANLSAAAYGAKQAQSRAAYACAERLM